MDSKPSLPHAFPFFLPYIVPLITVQAHYSPHVWHSLIPPFFVWVLIPICDVLISKNSTSPRRLTLPQLRHLESQVSFKLAVHCWCPVQLAMLFWAAHRVTQTHEPVHGIRLLGLVWSTALIAAEGINCSHELLHRRSAVERFLGKLLLTSVLYGHFVIEHARGHHFTVATLEDPATMRFGESIYRFLPRTIVGGYRSAWKLEKGRLARAGLGVCSVRNEMILYALGQLSFCVAFYVLFGVKGLMLFFFQAAVAVLLLEQINAIEHYGLVRRKLPSGEFERVGPKHSWDAPHRVSSYLLFKLQVHADHHLRKLTCFLSERRGHDHRG